MVPVLGRLCTEVLAAVQQATLWDALFTSSHLDIHVALDLSTMTMCDCAGHVVLPIRTLPHADVSRNQ